MTTVSVSQSSPYRIFRNRSFTLIWTGQLVSTVGSALTSLAAGILIYRLTGSALSVGLMLMATAVPSLLVGLVAGVFVDRLDRRRIMIAADLVRAVLVALIPLLIHSNIAWLYLIVMLSSGLGQFFDPALESTLPEVATDEELASANSLMAISSFGSTAIGFAASGLIASAFSIDWAFYIDALTFLFSAICILLIRMPAFKGEEKTSVASVVTNLRGGLKYLFDNRLLRSLFFISAPVFLSFGMWNTLLLPFALRALHASEFEYGLQEGLTSVGFVIGSLLMASLADRLREGQWVVISFIGMGLIGILYGLSTNIPVAILFVMISGFLNAPASIIRRVIIQRNTQREMRGRVSSAFFVSRDVVFLIGMAAAGLADVIDVRGLVIGSSLLLIGAGLAGLFMAGIGQPAAQWRRTISLLRGALASPGLGIGRAATAADFDLLASRFPGISGLRGQDWRGLAAEALVCDAPAGTTILRKGETSNNAYFILEGRAVAGREEGGQYRLLEVLNAGDFFGEIAALTGTPRTANVVAEEPSVLLQLPGSVLRKMMADAQLNRIFMNKMTERMVRMNMLDMPRYVGLDQQALRELRTDELVSPD
jgi:MFS transporter, DHA3 family, macrolide efflux protein